VASSRAVTFQREVSYKVKISNILLSGYGIPQFTITSSLLILSHWFIYHSVLPLVNLTIQSGIILSKIIILQLAAMKPLQIFIIAVVLLPIQLQRMHYYKNANNFSKLLAVLQEAVIEAIDIAEANRQL
jgi:hypothetical protein